MLGKTAALSVVYLYIYLASPFFGGSCRFNPSCSRYAAECLKEKQLFEALKMIFFRLLKCRPGGSFGYDPVKTSRLIKDN